MLRCLPAVVNIRQHVLMMAAEISAKGRGSAIWLTTPKSVKTNTTLYFNKFRGVVRILKDSNSGFGNKLFLIGDC